MSRGIQPKKTKTRNKVHELLKQGRTDQEILDEIGCCPSLVNQVKRAYGYTNQPQPLSTKRLVDIVADLLKTETPIRTIAKKRETNLGTVRAIYNRLRENRLSVPERQVGRPKDDAQHYADELGIEKDVFLSGLVDAWKKYRDQH